MRFDVSMEYPAEEGKVIIWIHNFPKDAYIQVLEAIGGMSKKVLIGNVEVSLFEKEGEDEHEDQTG